eukprot:344679-Chlamydomonas_euryale.AAC.1
MPCTGAAGGVCAAEVDGAAARADATGWAMPGLVRAPGGGECARCARCVSSISSSRSTSAWS